MKTMECKGYMLKFKHFSCKCHQLNVIISYYPCYINLTLLQIVSIIIGNKSS